MSSVLLTAGFLQGRTSNKRSLGLWPPYHWLDHSDFKTTVDDFWRVRYNETDVAMSDRFIEILRLSKSGLNGDEIGRKLGINNVRKYLTGDKKSFLTHLRAEHDRLGSPRSNCKWLPLRLKPRGTPDKDWILVPREIRGYEDVVSVLKETEPKMIVPDSRLEFGYTSREEIFRDRADLFGFFVGATIGDAGKHPKGESKFISKAVSLVLSKAKVNSFRFGEFTCLCAGASLGLDLHRIADTPASRGRYTTSECYRWASAATPLMSWIFHDILGLHNGELTTYDPLRMEWLVGASRQFKTSVLQGMTESDGWVDAGSDTVCLVSSPNTRLIGEVLGSLGVSPRVDKQEKVDVIRIPTEEAAMLPIFNPKLHSVYFDQMQVMSLASRLPDRVRLPADVVNHIRDISSDHDTLAGICFELSRTYGIKLSSQTVKKYITAR